MSRYQSINEVPKGWQRLEGVTLSLAQIEQIVEEAESSSEPFAVAITHAKESFKQSHHVIAGFWVPKGE